MAKNDALVAVVMGSASDREVMQECLDVLKELKIPYESRVLSAHRCPEETRDFALAASRRGIQVVVAGAGWAAHLAGFIAAHTSLPVIGVPIDSSPLKGVDSLLSTVQMPPGIPVATVSLGKGGAKNAAVLAAQILALKSEAIGRELATYRENLRKGVIDSGRDIER